MNISSRQLKAFVLTGAPSEFFPRRGAAVHHAIGMSVLVRELEGQLGFRLFDRTTRKVALTEFGHDGTADAAHHPHLARSSRCRRFAPASGDAVADLHRLRAAARSGATTAFIATTAAALAGRAAGSNPIREARACGARPDRLKNSPADSDLAGQSHGVDARRSPCAAFPSAQRRAPRSR